MKLLDTPPGFWAHLKSPLPELPRMGLWLWGFMPALGGLASLFLTRDDLWRTQGSVWVTVWVMVWLSGALLCTVVWLSPAGQAAGMRGRRDWSSALGDALGLLWRGVFFTLATAFLLVPLASDNAYMVRMRTTDMLLRAAPVQQDVAERLLAGQPINAAVLDAHTLAQSPVVRVWPDGSLLLHRPKVRVAVVLTPHMEAGTVAWTCQGWGPRMDLSAVCRNAP